MKLSSLFLLLLLPFLSNAQAKNIVVAKDGTGDFITVQQAINAVVNNNPDETVIRIKAGIYKEKLTLPESKINVKFIGAAGDQTILTFDDFASKKDSTGKDIGTSGSASFFIYGNGFSAENIVFENSAGPVGQAVAVRVTGDKASFINCKFLGFQDTLYTHGTGSREYYYHCYIEGTVDFIFGAATALFEQCIIYGKRSAFYTAASTPQGTAFGYVFKNCKITGDTSVTGYFLGRPWRPYAKTVYLQCNLGKQVNPLGWNNWGKVENEKTTFYAEYKCTGVGADLTHRVSWSHQLTEAEASEYTIANIFGGWIPNIVQYK
jgi:pectinesterase